MKFISHLKTTPHIKAMARAMKLAGLRVVEDYDDAGTVEAFHKDTSIFMAIQKGHNAPWIVRHVENLFS